MSDKLFDDEFDTDEFLRDKDAVPLVDEDNEETELRELSFDSKFDRNANFKEMAEDFTATEEWE
jgi:hypothetical protein